MFTILFEGVEKGVFQSALSARIFAKELAKELKLSIAKSKEKIKLIDNRFNVECNIVFKR